MREKELKQIFREYGVGAGAFEYALQYVDGLSRQEAAYVIRQLLEGELNDPEDKRIKRCEHCGYYWRDDSLRNTKRTCSNDCKRSHKTNLRRQQRADEALLNPKPRKRTLMDDYIWWIEYPFWINEYSMIKIGWKFEKPSGIALMDYVESKNETYGPGNRRKTRKEVEYHGGNRDEF